MRLLKEILLRPLSVLYGMATSIRNLLYDRHILKSKSFAVPVICVGNITVGGTGKTPHVEYIANLLSGYVDVSVLSRGYRRKSRGFRIVNPLDSAVLTGDEPLQIANRLRQVTVAVDTDRAKGIEKLLSMSNGRSAIVLDDGFQHRSVKAGLNIILTDYGRLMTRDNLLPYGRLRESLRGLSRAHVIIVTKTPATISDDEMKAIENELSPGKGQHLFFTSLEYDELIPVDTSECSSNTELKRVTPGVGVVLVTGIANPAPLTNYLSLSAGTIIPMTFSDHHYFSKLDISKINEAFETLDMKEKMIITTEKDAVRLKDLINIASPFRNKFYYLPVRIKFIKNEELFIKIITDYAG
jgi:tetraacyldisaccharide 4'-kinase